MTWSIVDVARLSGVTARALRHYDAIGLLRPAEVGANGYRRYGREELLRLQDVLLLRELGLPLSRIAAVLDRRTDRVAALRDHHAHLLRERDRLSTLVATVERTIAGLTGAERGEGMDEHPEDLFEGFDHSRYAGEAQERWPAQYAESLRADASTPTGAQRLQEDWTARLRQMAALRDAGVPVDDPLVQNEMDGVHALISSMWTPTAASFAGLGRLYADDERFRATFDAVQQGLAEYFRDAMALFAQARLPH